MNIKTKFKNYLNSNDEEDELFFNTFQKEVIKDLSSKEAYLLIDEIVELIIDEKDEYYCFQFFLLMLEVIIISDTTQLPSSLGSKLPFICKKLDMSDEYVQSKVNELKSWYRL